jgi:hypothetical protein
MVMADCAGWIGIFRKAPPGRGSYVAFVLLPLSCSQFYGALDFILLDTPPAPPVFKPDCATRIDILCEAASSFGGQIALVLFFMRVARVHVRHSGPPDPPRYGGWVIFNAVDNSRKKAAARRPRRRVE